MFDKFKQTRFLDKTFVGFERKKRISVSVAVHEIIKYIAGTKSRKIKNLFLGMLCIQGL